MFKLLLSYIPYPFQNIPLHHLPDNWLNQLKAMFSVSEVHLNKLEITPDTIKLYESLTDSGYRIYESDEKKVIHAAVSQLLISSDETFQTDLRKLLEHQENYQTIETLIHRLFLKHVTMIAPEQSKLDYFAVAEAKGLIVNPTNLKSELETLTAEQRAEIEQSLQTINFQPFQFLFELLKLIEQDLEQYYSYQPIQSIEYPQSNIQQFTEYFSRLLHSPHSDLLTICYNNQHKQAIDINWSHLSIHLIKHLQDKALLEISKYNLQTLEKTITNKSTTESSKKFILTRSFDFNSLGYMLSLLSNDALKIEILCDFLSPYPLKSKLEFVFLSFYNLQNTVRAISKFALKSFMSCLHIADKSLKISESFFQIELGKKPIFLQTLETQSIPHSHFIYYILTIINPDKIYQLLRHKTEHGESFFSFSLKNFPQKLQFILIAMNGLSIEQKFNCFYDVDKDGAQILDIALTCELSVFPEISAYFSQVFSPSEQASLLCHLNYRHQNILINACLNAPHFVPNILKLLTGLDMSSQMLILNQLEKEKNQANVLQLVAYYQPNLLENILDYLLGLPSEYQTILFSHRDPNKNNIFHFCTHLTTSQFRKLIQVLKNLSPDFIRNLILELNNEMYMPIFKLSHFSPLLIEVISEEVKLFPISLKNHIFSIRSNKHHSLMMLWSKNNIEAFKDWLTYFLTFNAQNIHLILIDLLHSIPLSTAKTEMLHLFLNTPQISQSFMDTFADCLCQLPNTSALEFLYETIFQIYQNESTPPQIILNTNKLIPVLFKYAHKNNTLHEYLHILDKSMEKIAITEHLSPFFYQILSALLETELEYLIAFSGILTHTQLELNILCYPMNDSNLLHDAIHHAIQPQAFQWLLEMYSMHGILAIELQENILQYAIELRSIHIPSLFESIKTLNQELQFQLLTAEKNCLFYTLVKSPVLLPRVLTILTTFNNDLIKACFSYPP
jgi:hypothetical protein